MYWNSFSVIYELKNEDKFKILKKRKNSSKWKEIYTWIFCRNKLSTWISQCAESRFPKSGGTATKLRDEGNAKFRLHDNEGALKLYTESIICSPELGPELSLGYGNRSAALYHIGQYEDCLQDIEQALKTKFPRNLEYKLHQRKGMCLTKLGQYAEGQKAFVTAMASLDMVPKMTKEKKESIVRDIHALMAEAEKSSQRLSQDSSNENALIRPPLSPQHGNNDSFPGASSILEVKMDEKKGRYVVASKPVKVGDVLFSEMPYASVLLPEHYSSHCHHCVSFFVCFITVTQYLKSLKKVVFHKQRERNEQS